MTKIEGFKREEDPKPLEDDEKSLNEEREKNRPVIKGFAGEITKEDIDKPKRLELEKIQEDLQLSTQEFQGRMILLSQKYPEWIEKISSKVESLAGDLDFIEKELEMLEDDLRRESAPEEIILPIDSYVETLRNLSSKERELEGKKNKRIGFS